MLLKKATWHKQSINMVLFRWYLCVLLSFPVSFLFAQNNEECKQKLLNCTKESFVSTSKNFALLEIKIQTYPKNAYSAPTAQNLKTISGNGVTVYENGQISFYQDESQSFTIVHEAKRIFWKKGSSKIVQTDNPNVSVDQLPSLKLKIIETAEVMCLGDTLLNGSNVKIVELNVGKEMQNLVNFRKIRYYMDWEYASIQKQIMEYSPNHQYTKQIIEYIKQDKNYQGNVYPNVKQYIFDANGGLFSQYKNYKLEKIGF